MPVLAALALTTALATQVPGQTPNHIADIRVQGNYRTTNDEVHRLAAVRVGDPVDAETVASVQKRLDDSGRFDQVEVRKRWRNLDETGDVVLVILVWERPVAGSGIAARVLGSLRTPMALPIVDYDDGYGLTYGVRLSPVNLLGARTHVSFPLTWGATREAAAMVTRPFDRGPFTSLSTSASWRERENPYFDTDEARRSIGVRVERRLGRWLRAGASGEWADVHFGALDERSTTWGMDLAIDTRTTTGLPRNEIAVKVGWERLRVAGAPVDRFETDARGFIGLPGAAIVAVRALHRTASRPLPLYEQPLLGGASSVRGLRVGHDVGDQLTAASVELRMPFTSPISFGRMGATAFVDTGTAYPARTRLRDAAFETSVGGGLFFGAAIFNLNLDLARALDHGWRLHIASGFRF